MNAVLAATVLREAFYLRNLAGLFLTVVGSVVVVTNAPPPYDTPTLYRIGPRMPQAETLQ